jgi:ABC-type nitrate/sulfonate/bicarbonate transport system substrate-binding protein
MMRMTVFVALTLNLFLWAPVRGEVITIGISTPGLYEIPTEIAQRKGFYKDEGLEVRKVVVRTGLHIAALMAGELDYSTVSGLVGRATMQGLPVKGVMGWFDRPLHILVARPGYKTIGDLRGKRIAVSTIGAAPHIIVREALTQAGVNPDKEVAMLAVGGSSDRLNALVSGAVDATALDLAYIDRAEKLGLVPLLYLGDIVNLRLGGFGVSMDKIQKNPRQIVRTIRATLKGVRSLKDNRSDTLAIMRDYLHVSAPVAEKIHEFSLRSLNVDGLVAPSTLAAEIRLAKEQMKISDDITGDKLMDWRFIKEVLAEK